MNAERLHAITLAIRADLRSTGAVQKLQQIRDALQNQVSQPNQPQHQQQVSSFLEQLTVALEQAPSNDFSPAWQQVVAEIGASEILGRELLERVREIFARNQITPSVAQQEITQLHQKLEKLSNSLEQLVQALSVLRIGAEELEPGECELGFLVPRSAVHNRLGDFGAELAVLNKSLSAFAELAVGSRPGFEIRTISSTDLTVFLDLIPEVGACVAIAVERIVALYKQLLEIRLHRRALAEQGLTEKSLQGIDAHANSHMKDGIAVLIGELIEQYAADVDEGRRNELRIELRVALNRLANRIDKGYNIEIRVEPLGEPPYNEEVSPEEEVKRQATAAILRAANGLQFLKPIGDPILTLPEPEGENEDKEDT